MSFLSVQVICDRGAYCPSNSSSPSLCPTSTFSNAPGQSAESDCLNCTAGFYCEERGLRNVSGPCLEGKTMKNVGRQKRLLKIDKPVCKVSNHKPAWLIGEIENGHQHRHAVQFSLMNVFCFSFINFQHGNFELF